MLEGEKAFMKDFISKLNIPTAKYKEVSTKNLESGLKFIDDLNTKIALKASRPCSRKGVLILESKTQAKEKLQDMLSGKMFCKNGEVVVIEEFLDGYELSIFAISNGNEYILLPSCQDHKRLLNTDKGPNTGGMGAYTNPPSNLYNDELKRKIDSKIIKPTMEKLKNDGEGYRGVLFAWIMVVDNEPLLLEYNTRFGDPECEILLPTLQTPLLDIMLNVVRGDSLNIDINNKSFVGVVVSSGDYAQENEKLLECNTTYPTPITLREFDKDLGHISFANVGYIDGVLNANSGRVAVCVGSGDSIKEARNNAYNIVKRIEFNGKHFRDDIGLWL